MIKSKNWLLSFFLIIFVGMGCYMALNYYANPLGYFRVTQGETRVRPGDYTRSIKAEYILEHKDEIDAVIMGGSKSGVVSTDQMTAYTGLNYYNMYWNLGNFSDYLRFTEFLIEKTDIKEISLVLSSYEVRAYDRTDMGNEYQEPAILSGSVWDKFTETLSYLVTDQSTLRKYLNITRNKSRKNWDNLANGSKYMRNKLKSFTKDPEAFIQKNVLRKLDKRLASLFVNNDTEDSQRTVRAQSLEAMHQIKELCDQNDVTLKVIIGPSAITERYYYENTSYYTYIAELTNIVGEIWDFSDFNSLNMNPYNFYNEKHYSPALADLMVDTIYGVRSVEGFGQILTPDNVQAKMQERLEDFQRLQAEYEKTGTLELEGFDDDSYIPWSKKNGIFAQEVASR